LASKLTGADTTAATISYESSSSATGAARLFYPISSCPEYSASFPRALKKLAKKSEEGQGSS
jgi:hypothetical protein